jgi:hypothetical protein
LPENTATRQRQFQGQNRGRKIFIKNYMSGKIESCCAAAQQTSPQTGIGVRHRGTEMLITS